MKIIKIEFITKVITNDKPEQIWVERGIKIGKKAGNSIQMENVS